MEVIEIIVPQSDAGVRLDKFLTGELDNKTRSSIVKMIDNGCIAVGGKAVKKNYSLSAGDCITVEEPPLQTLDVAAEDIPLDILYEDADLLVVNKPKEMVVHPAAGNYSGTLVNALLYHCRESLSGINGVIRPGIVHRIDKNTSGLLIVAKNDAAHVFLAEQIKEHSFSRTYEAIVYGRMKEQNGSIDLPVGRHPKDRKKMCVTDRNSKCAVTHFQVLEEWGQFSHLSLRLETGRTHQIRVHMAYMGHPVAGDDVYGPRKCITELHGQCLHAKSIGFIHPTSKEYMEFDSPLPEYFQKFMEKVKRM